MIKTYKILSLLLSYPNQELQDFLVKVENELLEEGLLSADKINGIAKFCENFINTDIIDWQAEYVQLFDYSRSVSLHLFEHVQGDSRDRGQAMVDLMEFYKENDMKLTSSELPDYIPAFLEFLSTLSVAKSAELLGDTINIVDRINVALSEKDNPYSHVFQAIIFLSAKKPNKAITHEMIKNEKPMDLDAEYEEAPVTFGGCKGCETSI
ncbi:MAG TPA: nitrate reductase molybdenum cofactor assembly chaperone [Bacteroidales bacterium]|mgnify:CR=1 FL=1|jgi:nitrate reductase delta subunit|nr:nitrate reductase molybdenum cofactor assembly chaperone [Bacteroidales bacterium]